MKVWLVMSHEGPAEDDSSPGSVERVFASQSEAIAFLDSHVERSTANGTVDVLVKTHQRRRHRAARHQIRLRDECTHQYRRQQQP